MKKFAILLLTAISIVAFGQSDWMTMWPNVNGIPINNLCTEGDNIKSVDPIRLCVRHKEVRKACYDDGFSCRTLRNGERAHGNERETVEVTCTRYEEEIAEFPRLQWVSRCVKFRTPGEWDSGECYKWENKYEMIPLDYKVDIYRNAHSDIGPQYSHTIDYSILECF